MACTRGCSQSAGIMGHVSDQNNSLNMDPFNLRAEELALQDCTLGVEVRRTWSETELVRTFGGRMPPGTPDGMFESWNGNLTCVQVVRVPLVSGSDNASMQHTLAQTILSKVVKSQAWLRFTATAPHDFIIFCWLPFQVPDAVQHHVEMLMERVRLLDRRFSARLRLPAEPHAIFPALFACNHDFVMSKSRGLSESDISTFESDGEEEEEEKTCEWDITWDWTGEDSAEDAAEQPQEATCEDESHMCRMLQSNTAAPTAAPFTCHYALTWDDNG
mmetsp:Transcript_55840/g.133563  ORF Transcript_55840/g.133563 Transcript_55840/m.133563 type:complete len:274 (+) Transcript_55840:206-1027(+)